MFPPRWWFVCVCGGGYDGGMSEVSTRVSEAGGRAPDGLMYMPEGVHEISATFNGKAATKRVVVDEAACIRLQADLERIWERVEAGLRARPVVYFNHTAGAVAMVPKRFSWVPGKGVVLEGEWTAAGREAVEGGSYAYCSPCFRRSESGRVMGLLTQGVEVGSLVNDPAFECIECIAAARCVPEAVEEVCCARFSPDVYPPRGVVAYAGVWGDNADAAGGGGSMIMDENKLKMLLGLPADADSAAVEAALQKAAGAGKRLEAVEAELATLKKKEHEHKEKAAGAFAAGLIKKGVIGPHDNEKVAAAKKLYMQSPEDAEAVFGALPEHKEEAAVAGKVHPEADGAARADISVMDSLVAEFRV